MRSRDFAQEIAEVEKGNLDPNQPDANGSYLIFEVIGSNNLELVNRLLNTNKVDLSVKFEDQTPLQLAAQLHKDLQQEQKSADLFLKAEKKRLLDIGNPSEDESRYLKSVLDQLEGRTFSGSQEMDRIKDVIMAKDRQNKNPNYKSPETPKMTSPPTLPLVAPKTFSEGGGKLMGHMKTMSQLSQIITEKFDKFINEKGNDEESKDKKKLLNSELVKLVEKYNNTSKDFIDDRAKYNKIPKKDRGESFYISQYYEQEVKSTNEVTSLFSRIPGVRARGDELKVPQVPVGEFQAQHAQQIIDKQKTMTEADAKAKIEAAQKAWAETQKQSSSQSDPGPSKHEIDDVQTKKRRDSVGSQTGSTTGILDKLFKGSPFLTRKRASTVGQPPITPPSNIPTDSPDPKRPASAPESPEAKSPTSAPVSPAVSRPETPDSVEGQQQSTTHGFRK